MTSDILCALTIDVEDYYQVSAFERQVRREDWDGWESRVETNTHRVLAMLDRHSTKATFFVLGWTAERFPRLVRAIHAAGHEIASHGYWHRLVYSMSPEEFRADLRRSRTVLEDAIGVPVTAYRAASFSITRESLWALEILVEEGFQVDSSIFPMRHDLYGIPGARRELHRRATAAGSLWEFPPTVAKLGRLDVPVGGGGYFRVCPLAWTRFWLRRVLRTRGGPFVFYFHPWEIDPGQPRIPSATLRSRLRHYTNLATTQAKLDLLLRAFRFGRLSEVIEQSNGAPALVSVGS
jgi:polysaccharide deacetylase family protein (PEP-CTERM system associated)